MSEWSSVSVEGSPGPMDGAGGAGREPASDEQGGAPPLLEAALSYADRGWHVVPLHSPTPTGCSCGKPDCRSAGKHPRTDHGEHDATTDLAQIQSWWRRWPDANIGIACAPSRLAVADIDPRNGGDATLDRLIAAQGPLPETPTVLTGGGGQHHYFQAPPEGTHVPYKPGAGVEVKTRGLVVAPPSLHVSGRRYEVEASAEFDDVPLAPLPRWLLGGPTQDAPFEDPPGVTLSPQQVTALRSALNFLRADDYETWIAIGHALKELREVGRGLWLDWSQTSTRWRPEDARRWDTFRPERTGYQAVFAKAQAAGWVNPASKESRPEDPTAREGGKANPAPDGPEATDTLDIGLLPSDIDTLVIPPRPWVIHPRLLGGTITVTAGPPGVGKSAFEIASLLSVATGRPLLEEAILRSGPVWYYNNEETKEELLRRLLAACKHHGIPPSSVRDRFQLSSGYGRPLVVAKRLPKTGEIVPTPVVHELVRVLKDCQVLVFAVDPAVSTHTADENSNTDIEQVVAQWRYVARETGCAIVIASHTRKSGKDPEAHVADMEALRGASALVGAARQVFTLARISAKTASRLIDPRHIHPHLVRLDNAKLNYAPSPNSAHWLRMASVSLTDALYDVDQVGVFEHYTPQWVAEDKLPQQEGRSERHVRLAQAVERLGLAPGETRPLSALKEKLAAATGLSQAWLYANLAMALPERGTADADGGEYN